MYTHTHTYIYIHTHAAHRYTEPQLRDVLSGYPGGYCFRVDRPPTDKVPFKTRLGGVWPKHEGRPPSDLTEPYFPARLATTENHYPGGPPQYTASARFTKFVSTAPAY